MTHTIYIRGIDDWPDVNMRDKPGLIGSVIVHRVAKGNRATCDAVKADVDGDNFNGQVYQWFQITLEDGRQGWVRDDLIDIEGDGRSFGYGFYATRTYAFNASKQVLAAVDTSSLPGPPEFNEQELCTAKVRADIAANVRSKPTTQSALVKTLSPNTQVSVLKVVDGENSDRFQWIRMRTGNTAGYIREDLLVYSSDCDGLNLDPPPQVIPDTSISESASGQGRFVSPVNGAYSISQAYVGGHKGVDLASTSSPPVIAGGIGKVSRVVKCTKCTDDKPSAIQDHGYPAWDDEVIYSAEWGWGFGNFVVVKYAWDDLPATMQTHLISIGLAGAFAYVIYAHLKSINVALNEGVNKGTVLGILGNTGNSKGAHLHFEVAVSMQSNLVSLKDRIRVDPAHLFLF